MRDGDPLGGDQLWDSEEDQPSPGLAVTRPETWRLRQATFLGRSLRLYQMRAAPQGSVLTV